MTTEPRLHTEGPWKIGKAQWKRGGPPYKIPITGGAGGVICNVLIHESFQGDARNPIMPGPNANAALIARAPELAARVEELEANAKMHAMVNDARAKRFTELTAENARLTARVAELENWLTMRTKSVMESELTADNARLRELLRRAAHLVPVENPLTPELRKELGQ